MKIRKSQSKVLLLILLSVFAVGLFAGCGGEEQEDVSGRWQNLKIWYDQPAKEWTEALPVGNGRLGAMVFGKTGKETIQLNEETLWTGGPYDASTEGGAEALSEIQELVFNKEYMKAHKLFGRKMMGWPVEQQKYQPLGDLLLTFPGHEKVSDYRRLLDLDEAVVRVTYRVGEVNYTREVFASPVDQVIVVHLTADKSASINFNAVLAGFRNVPHSNYDSGYFRMDPLPPDGLILQGKNSTYLGIEGRLTYQARAKVVTKGGKIETGVKSLTVSDADEVTILIAAATSFVDYKDVSGDPAARVNKVMENIRDKFYDRIRSDHVTEHRRLFRRVELDLGTDHNNGLPMDKRLIQFARGGNDPHLAELYYQFGRYMLISSSRPGTQAANLQGIWNKDGNPNWDSKYTTNINLEMNYWPAEVSNLSECVEPFIRLVSELVEPGSKVAKKHYGADGWVFHQNTDLWRAAAPMDGPSWGTFTVGGAWLCTHLWEHYLFGGDEQFLESVYPILKGSVEFFADFLIKHPDHDWLVTNPATSPENVPTREGNVRFFDEIAVFDVTPMICAGPTMDMQILRDLFDIYIKSAEILDRDQNFRDQVFLARQKLAPMQLGQHGQLQEWLEDWDDPDDHHRHASHLWGLYPSHQISIREKPELAEAAKKSILMRGDGVTGFGISWNINLWARLLDGRHAHEAFRTLIEIQTCVNLFSKCFRALQVDGLFGATAGIAEMLLQSHAGEINFLPAIPSSWSTGFFKGLRARGGFEIDLKWQDNKLITAEIHSKLGNKCRIRNHIPISVVCEGETILTTAIEQDLFEFETESGKKYEVTEEGI